MTILGNMYIDYKVMKVIVIEHHIPIAISHSPCCRRSKGPLPSCSLLCTDKQPQIKLSTIYLSQFGEQHKRVQQRQWGAHEAGQEQPFSVLGLSFKASKHDAQTVLIHFQLFYCLHSMHHFHMLFNFIIVIEGNVTHIAYFIFHFFVHSFDMLGQCRSVTKGP